MVTEVATFRAAAVDVPFSEVVDDPNLTREQHIRNVLSKRLSADRLADLQAHPERLQAWNDYSRRFAWVPRLAGASAQGAILWIKGLNGEKNWADVADPTRGGEPLPATLPMPALLTLNWRMAGGNCSAEITLDPVETVAAFKKLSTADRPGPMTLMLEPSATGAAVDVFLRRGELAYRFKNNKTEIFGGG